MKIISSIFFCYILIHAIFCSEEEGFIITFQKDGLVTYDCSPDPLKYIFGMKVITSGFVKPFEFTLYLENPSYAYASCVVPITTEGDNYISCEIDTTIFPLYPQNKITFRQTLTSSTISIEGWEENVGLHYFLLNNYCGPSPFAYSFNQNQNSKFYIDYYNSNGFPVVSAYGIFSDLSGTPKNYLTKTEDYITYTFQPYYFSDGKISQAYCEVNVPNTNSEDVEDKISCVVQGEKEAILFYTTALELTEQTDNKKLVQVNILDQVSLNGSYLKLTGLLLLSLLF
jgi:hypothetical protein